MRTFLIAAALASVAVLTFWPGVHGGFVFDDFANLPAIGAYGPVDNLRTLLLYLTSGKADPTGRPLALLSFLIDARNWPTPPLSFKITGVLVHAGNAALLFALLRRLQLRLPPATAPDLTAFLATGFWALHPLLLSTTLYVVQRETSLAGTFVLAGLHLWISARDRFDAARPRQGWLLAMAAIPLCTALAILCKANGALLPLLAWTVDSLVLRPGAPQASQPLRRARGLFFVLPSAALLAYLILIIPAAARATEELRPWTLGARVLAQPLILLDYLKLLLLPRAVTAGVFQDAITLSGRLDAATLAAIIFWLAVGAAAWWLRRRQPALSLAALFFLAGHLMESSVIPLEPYFEHRNYVPAMLLFWPLARWLTAAGTQARWKRLGGIAALALLAVTTHLGARTWGDSFGLARTWAQLAPDSPRAQTYVARAETEKGEYAAAERRLLRLNQARPEEIQVAFALADLYCVTGHYDPSVEERVKTALATAPNDTRLGFDWLLSAIDSPRLGNCPGLELDGVARMVAALKSNARMTRNPGRRQDIAYVEGSLALARGNVAAAVQHFDTSLDLLTRPEVALNQAAMLGNAGYPREGVAHLDRFRELYSRAYHPWPDMPHIHSWLMQKLRYWDAELDALRASLAAEAAATPEPAP